MTNFLKTSYIYISIANFAILQIIEAFALSLCLENLQIFTGQETIS